MKKLFSQQSGFKAGLFIILLPGGIFTTPASLVSQSIHYQTFRDFATNNGVFLPGTKNIKIKDKAGNLVGLLNKAPMPDFSNVNSTGIATLIYPQYAVSVHHNFTELFSNLYFGGGLYHVVDRNNIPDKDFSVIRLNKLVAEAVPAALFPADMDLKLFEDKARFPVFYRIGSGTQEIKDKQGKISRIDTGYHFLTGGTTGSPNLDSLGRLTTHSGDIFNPDNGPLASFALHCDSGSPLFAWDASLNKWLVVATLSMTTAYEINDNVYAITPPDFIARARQNNNDALVTNLNSKSLLTWRFDKSSGEGRIVQGKKVYAMHGFKEHNAHHGKDLAFSGNGGVLFLKDDVNQGAGSLTFNHNYTVMPQYAQTWSGGGVNVARAAKVIWRVNGVENDKLHKIGEGVLHVSGRGINPGGLKVGDGTVMLAQRPDKLGKVQAFSSLEITSGRPRVVLSDARQINPDTLSWGFRGGQLDVNGNDLTFRQLHAADYGAVLTNTAKKQATITLNYPGGLGNIPVREWLQSMQGTPGDLYSYQNSSTRTMDYFLLKKEKYSWFPDNQRSDMFWEFIGHDRDTALRIVFERRKAADYIFHGQLKGKLNISHRVEADTTGTLALDGSVDITGNFSQENGRLIFQGHPVIHAYNTPEIVQKLQTFGDNSLKTQPVSFWQPDWERRTFKVSNLILKNTRFDLARNASLSGKITARRSVITLGSPSLLLDLNDGGGVQNRPQAGTSSASHYDDLSRYQGTVSLADNSVLDIREKFTGSITGQQSKVNVDSRQVLFEGYSSFSQTPLTLEKNAKLTARAGWTSDSPITVGPSATLQLTGLAGKAKDQVIPSRYTLRSGTVYELKTDGVLRVSPFVSFTGDILASSRAAVQFGTKDKFQVAEALTPEQQKTVAMLNGFKNSWQGAITAPKGRVNLTDTRWGMRGDSQAANLILARSFVGFSGGGSAFRTLKVDNLQANKSAIVLRTDLQTSDKLVVSKKAKGQNNALFLDLIKQPTGREQLSVPLITTPAGTSVKMFNFTGYVSGFSRLNPVINVSAQAGQTQWILTGFKRQAEAAKMAAANSFLALEYKKFITLVNNLNKRMGELRNTEGQAGIWLRTANSSGAGEDGYADRYVLLQSGFDKKHRLRNADLFTGVMVSYTKSHARGRNYAGNIFSYGAGLYASAMFDSGVWVDVIGKYIKHKNSYQAGFAGPGQHLYTTHSWYGGLEMGYRYRLAKGLFIEPQAELIYGAVSGNKLRWQENGLDVSIHQKNAHPVIARAGVTVGKRFSGINWAVTLRGGLDFQTDLRANGKSVLRDAWQEQRANGKKDSRMLYHAGVNGQIGSAVRFGLEVERSAFGKYNINHAVNANVRYSF